MGGSRLKRTALLCNNDLITGLAVTCDGSHEHLPWEVHEGVLATKLETAYPHQFCKHFVSLLLQHLTQKGCLNLLEGDPANSSGARVVTTQAKTKRAASFQVIPEFCRRTRWTVPADSAALSKLHSGWDRTRFQGARSPGVESDAPTVFCDGRSGGGPVEPTGPDWPATPDTCVSGWTFLAGVSQQGHAAIQCQTSTGSAPPD